jgi:KDO2-lipid IV(A) lauroyltransferase
MYWVLSGFAAVISRMSSGAIDAAARALAVLLFDVLRVRRGLVLRNLGIAFPDLAAAERVRIGRLSVYNFILTTLELFRSQGTDIARDVELRGVEHARAALAKRQGAYILCFHMGNWEAMGAACTRLVAPSHVLVKKVGSASVDRFVAGLREKNGFLTVKRRKKGDGFTAIGEVLARGEIVGFVMDQARPGEPKLPFFGRPAQTNTSLAAIWRRLPAPIIPAYVHRTGVSRHVVEFFPEVELTVTDDSAADILAHSTMFNQVVEKHVRKTPEQYFWMHNRWK